MNRLPDKLLQETNVNTNNGKMVIKHFHTWGDKGLYYEIGIWIKSGRFSGYNTFVLERDPTLEVIKSLETMYGKLSGRCEIHDYDSDSAIVFEFEEQNRISFHGQVGGTHRDNYLYFKYQIDPTCLPPIIQQFKKICSVLHSESS